MLLVLDAAFAHIHANPSLLAFDLKVNVVVVASRKPKLVAAPILRDALTRSSG
jgi:hypothetical protein